MLIADDHPLFRDGLARQIKSSTDLRLVAETGDGIQALRLIEDVRPDVAVLDLKLPGLDGIRVTARATASTATRILILSGFAERPLVFKALAAGAAGFISKDADRIHVCEAIAAVARGETVAAPEFDADLLEKVSRPAKPDTPPLTTREREVLSLIACGTSAPAIARLMHLSTGTVRTHKENLFAKLGVGDRAAAVAQAMRWGLLE